MLLLKLQLSEQHTSIVIALTSNPLCCFWAKACFLFLLKLLQCADCGPGAGADVHSRLAKPGRRSWAGSWRIGPSAAHCPQYAMPLGCCAQSPCCFSVMLHIGDCQAALGHTPFVLEASLGPLYSCMSTWGKNVVYSDTWRCVSGGTWLLAAMHAHARFIHHISGDNR